MPLGDELCFCGRPLHYKHVEQRQLVEMLINLTGDLYVTVTRTTDGRSWRVPRHYIALHGIKSSLLHTYGFEEVCLD